MWPETRRQWGLFLLGLGAVYALFDVAANALGSDRGQAGLLVAALVVGATFSAARWLLGKSAKDAITSLGLGLPHPRGLGAALVACVLLVLVLPAYVAGTGEMFAMYPGWLALVPGIFAQAGIAEETLFRAYLFGQLRRDRSFWRAAALASVPFVIVHLVLFVRLPFPIAFFSVLLATVISFPLAYLFDLGGRTIWAPALLHAVVQGVVKVTLFEDSTLGFALVWMAASAIVPFVVFAYRPEAAR